jgi:hypothetical protein
MKTLFTSHKDFIGSHLLNLSEGQYEVICASKKENLVLCNKVTASAPS